MNVFVLTEERECCDEVLGIFTTREKAVAYGVAYVVKHYIDEEEASEYEDCLTNHNSVGINGMVHHIFPKELL